MSREKGFIWVNDTEAGAVVPPEGHIVYARDTDTHLASDGTTLTAMGGGGGGLDAEGAQDAVGAMVDTSLVYTDATPLLSRAALTGDVTAAEGSNTTTIANDAVTYAKIQNVTDGRLLGRSAGSSGDVQEITVGSSLDLSSGSIGLPAWMSEYNPDRPPTDLGTGGFAEEFTGGAFSQSWQWSNQGSATDVVEQGMGKITGPGAVTGRVWRALVPPNGVNFTVTAKMYPGFSTLNSTTDFNGIWLLDTGTLAAPTKFYDFGLYPSGNYNSGLYALTMTGFNAWSSTQINTMPSGSVQVMYLQGRYTASTKTLSWYYSQNGRIWTWGAAVVFTNHPSYVGRFNSNGADPAYFQFFRVRTDANRNLAGE